MAVRYITVPTKIVKHPRGDIIALDIPSIQVGPKGIVEIPDIRGGYEIRLIEEPDKPGDEVMVRIEYEDRDRNADRLRLKATAEFRESEVVAIEAERQRIKQSRSVLGEVRGQ